MPGASAIDRLQSIFQMLDQSVLLLEGERILEVNPAFADLAGIDADDAEGQMILEFIAPDAREEMSQRLGQGDAGPFPALIRPAQGESIPVRVRHHEFAESGRHLHVLVMRDMRPQMQGSSRSADGEGRSEDDELERLRAQDRFKTQLLNTTAHELNTPITPLRLQTHLLKNRSLGELTPRQQRAVDILDRNVQRVSLLVKDILDVARMESDRLTVEPRSTDLDSLLDDVFESFLDAAEQVGIRLVRDGAADLAVMADPDRLVQVLYNLMSNALKFTPAGGKVTVDVERENDMVRVDVRDTGVGLTQEQIGTLFRPFSQAHDPKDFAATGSGLGLYISRGIVEAHGGSIECSSDGLEKGTTFTVRLPASDADQAHRATATGSELPIMKREDTMLDRLRELI